MPVITINCGARSQMTMLVISLGLFVYGDNGDEGVRGTDVIKETREKGKEENMKIYH